MASNIRILTAELDDASWHTLDESVRALEDAWKRGLPIQLGAFLPQSAHPVPARVLIELIKVDQEHRWSRGEPRRLEEYLRDWPDLNADHDALLELVAAECLTRAGLGDVASADEIHSRFPSLCGKIDLVEIQAAAQRELGGARGGEPHPTVALPDPAAAAAVSDTSEDARQRTPSAPAAVPLTPLPLAARFGRYELRSLIGRGGMGAVYRALDTQLSREVALKVPNFDPSTEPIVRDRFLREGRAAAAIRHPNVCPVYDVGQIDGTYYIAMALIEGQSLAARLQSHATAVAVSDKQADDDVRFSPHDAAEIVRKLASALDRVHAAGVIHRDIKPSNIMIDDAGEPLLMDFGLARQTDSGHEASNVQHLTTTGSLIGTPAYMSPEQVGGASTVVDTRTDVYSLGVLLYQMLTGKLPFAGPLTQVLMSIAQSAPPKPRTIVPTIAPALEAICLKAMAKRATDRYQTAGELAEALEAYLRPPHPIPVAPEEQRESVPPQRALRRWLIAGAAAAALFVGVTIYVNTGEGQLVLTVNESDVKFTIDGQASTLEIESPRDRITITVPAGKHELEVSKDGFITFTQSFRIVRNGKEELTAQLKPFLTKQTTAVPSEGVSPVRPEPLGFAAGEPLCPIALVTRPAVVEGLRSWTIETQGHRGAVAALSESSKAGLWASAGKDGTIRLWDSKTGKLVRALLGHTGAVVDLSWSSDGKTLATASYDETIRVWNPETGEMLRTMKGKAGRILAVAFWPNSQKLVAANERDDLISVWDASTGEWLENLKSSANSPVTRLSWSSDGTKLASVSNNGIVQTWSAGAEKKRRRRAARRQSRNNANVQTWEAGSWRSRLRLESANGYHPVLAWSPDGQTLANAGDRGKLLLWDAESGELRRTLVGHAGQIVGLSWSNDGTSLASIGADDPVFRIWDVETAATVRSFHLDVGAGLQTAVWSTDGQSVATGGDGSAVRLWNAETGGLLTSAPGHQDAETVVSWSPAGKLAAAGGIRGRMVRIWDLESSQEPQVLPSDDETYALAWSPNGALVASGDGHGGTRLWNVQKGQLAQHFTGQKGYVCALAWSGNSGELASGAEDGSLWIWRTDTGDMLHNLAGHTEPIEALSWSPKAKRLASSSGNTLRIWDTQTGDLLQTHPGLDGQSMAWSRDGATLAFAVGAHIGLLGVETGQVSRYLREHSTTVAALGWPPNRDRLISLSSHGLDNTVGFWEADSGELLRTVRGPEPAAIPFHDFLKLQALSADTKMVASGATSMVRLWETETGRSIGTLLSLRGNKHAVLNPDGHYRGSPGVESELVYVVHTDRGQQTLTPDEFAEKYGWKNDAEQVRLIHEKNGKP